MNQKNELRKVWVICVVLIGLVFAVFGQTVTHSFVDYDDDTYVYDNPVVARGLTWKGVAWAFDGAHAANWHPLTWLSHMLDCQLYGLQPGGHHLTNVVLQAAAAVALFLVWRAMTGMMWRSAVVAAIFAIHPLRAESVAWVAERKDLLSGLFFMLTIGAYARYARRPWSPWRYGLALFLYALGLMCKPMLVTLPLVLLLLDYWPLRRKALLEKLPFVAMSAAVCAVTLWSQGKIIQSAGTFSLSLRLGNALITPWIYLGQMVWPMNLAAFYPYPQNGWPIWKMAVAGLLTVSVGVVAWRERRRRPWLLTGWGWYLLMLLPVVGIVQVGEQSHADRYTYLPQIGLYFLTAWLIAGWGVKWPGWAAAVAVAALAVCAWRQTGYWKNDGTLWSHAIAATRDNYAAHFKLGVFFMQKGKTDAAIEQFESAVQIRPDYAQAQNDLGGLLLRQGETVAAIRHLEKAVEIKPDYGNARNNLADAYLATRDYKQALAQFQRAAQLEPDDTGIQNNLAWLLAACPDAGLRDGSQAVAVAQRANRLTGGKNALILHTLAAAFAEAGRFPEAVQTAQLSLNLAEAQSNPQLMAALQSERRLYEAGNRLPSR